jgi:ribosomal protein S16
MAIDQRDVSSTLRFMDDRALQQYAAMHKNDPYIFPLAFQESQNRQKLRMNQQAQAGAQPQPKVADAALAQMAPPQAQPMPEAQGIGALPAPNMQFAAEGGILGYDDADLAERSEPVVMMAEGGVARYQVGGPTFDPATGVVVADPAAYGGTDDRTLFERLGIFNPENRRALEKAEREQAIREEAAKAAKTPGAKAAAAAAPTTTTPAPTVDAAPKPDTTRKTGPSNKPAAAASTADKGPTGIEALADKLTRSTDLALGEQRNARAGLSSRMEQEATEYAADTKNRIKEEGDVFKGKEERLAAREKGIEGLGDKYMGLALLQAGAAMMSTPGNLGSVIGKGIQVGSERYIAGIDKINAAKDKFAEARDRLDDLRLNRDDMNKKEVRDADRAIRTARLQGQQLLVDGAGKDLEISNANQTKIFGAVANAMQSDKEIASKEGIARSQIAATLNTPDRILFDQLMKKNGNDATKALEAFKLAKGDKFDVRSSYADYLKAFAGKEGLTPPMSMGAYAGQFGATLPR